MVKFINFSVHRRLRIINKKRCNAFDVRRVSNAIKPVLEKPSQISNPRGSRFQCNILQRISVCQRNIMPDTRVNDTRKWRIVKNVARKVKGKKRRASRVKISRHCGDKLFHVERKQRRIRLRRVPCISLTVVMRKRFQTRVHGVLRVPVHSDRIRVCVCPNCFSVFLTPTKIQY